MAYLDKVLVGEGLKQQVEGEEEKVVHDGEEEE